MTDELKKYFDEAISKIDGYSHTPVLLLGTQVVAGTNHAILCKSTPSVAELNGATTYVLVYVYEDLQGNCEITETTDIELTVG